MPSSSSSSGGRDILPYFSTTAYNASYLDRCSFPPYSYPLREAMNSMEEVLDRASLLGERLKIEEKLHRLVIGRSVAPLDFGLDLAPDASPRFYSRYLLRAPAKPSRAAFVR
jgi:hypothetical protein